MKLLARLVVPFVLAVAPAAAHAQARGEPYISAGFSGFRLSSDDLDGSASGYDFGAGIGVLPWLAVEGSVFHPGKISDARTGKTRSFAGPGASFEEIERLAITERLLEERNGRTSFAVAAVFHAPTHYRVSPAAIFGVTWHRFMRRETREVVDIPVGVDPSRVEINPIPFERRTYRSYPTFGAKVSVAVTRHFLIVPDIRFDYGSLGDEIDNVLRSSIRAEWRF